MRHECSWLVVFLTFHTIYVGKNIFDRYLKLLVQSIEVFRNVFGALRVISFEAFDRHGVQLVTGYEVTEYCNQEKAIRAAGQHNEQLLGSIDRFMNNIFKIR